MFSKEFPIAPHFYPIYALANVVLIVGPKGGGTLHLKIEPFTLGEPP
jgi:hypothetical protein